MTPTVAYLGLAEGDGRGRPPNGILKSIDLNFKLDRDFKVAQSTRSTIVSNSDINIYKLRAKSLH